MKKLIIIPILSILCIIIISIIGDRMIAKLEKKLIIEREKNASDSLLLKQYQNAMREFIENEPDCSKKFIFFMEKLECQ